MSGTNEVIAAHMNAGWTWLGPTPVGEFFELRAAELPDFFVAGTSKEEVLNEVPEALTAYFESFLERGEELPAAPPVWVNSLIGLRSHPIEARVFGPPAAATTEGCLA